MPNHTEPLPMPPVKTVQDERIEMEAMRKTEPTPQKKKGIRFAMLSEEEMNTANMTPIETLEKSVSNTISAIRRGAEITRLAFEEDPKSPHMYGIWVHKSPYQVPDHVIKRIAIVDDLVAAIMAARANHVSPFGRELQDRFSVGFRIEPNRGVTEDWEEEQKEHLQARIRSASKRLASCGSIEGWDDDNRLSLASFLYQQTRNGLLFGRFATEIVWVKNERNEDEFHSFRPVDAATIYAAIPKEDHQGEQVRERALHYLEQLSNQKLVPEKVRNHEYAWYQVINGQPVQAFEAKEMIVHNMFPITDVELLGYPLTPIDTCIAAVTTHINITTHNKLYFQNGRAARGMIVINSEDASQDVLDMVRQHFQATANSVQNAWRVPVFGVGEKDKIVWQPIETQGGRDMEFQYLSDTNARVILSAYQMSPEELPGYQHLARGTNNMALSESNNEYKLEAARDVGIRPLLSHFQDFINQRILPLIDPGLVKVATLKLYGLDADTAEKESNRLQVDQALHMTYDEMLERVEKDPIGEEMGGKFPLNPAYQAVLDKYWTVGQIKAFFFGDKKAADDPQWAYVRDQFWFSWQEQLMQMQQMQMQQQQMAMQAQMGGGAPPSDGGGGDGGGGDAGPQSDKGNDVSEHQEMGKEQASNQGGEGVAGDAQDIGTELSKAEAQLGPNQRRILQQHRFTVKSAMKLWKQESKALTAKIVAQTRKK
jgi:hypothetical protein